MTTLKELRDELLDQSIPISQTMRKAYVLARTLKDPGFLKWVSSELNGYPQEEWTEDFPEYRRPRGQLLGRLGAVTAPVIVERAAVADKVTRPVIPFPVSEIEAWVDAPGVSIDMELHPSNAAILRKALQASPFLFLRYTDQSWRQMLEAVRNTLLDMVLDLMDKKPDFNPDSSSVQDRQEVKEQAKESMGKRFTRWIDSNKAWLTDSGIKVADLWYKFNKPGPPGT